MQRGHRRNEIETFIEKRVCYHVTFHKPDVPIRTSGGPRAPQSVMVEIDARNLLTALCKLL